VGAGLNVTRPERILTVPLRHEVLHTFGHGHQDFMAVTCEEAGVRMLGGSPAAREENRAKQEDMRRCLRGELARAPESVVPQLLRARFGYGLFLRYIATGKPKREALRAQGLSEVEADCAIFDTLTGRQARGIYRAAGASLNEANLEKGVALLTGTDTTVAVSDGGGNRGAVNRAVHAARQAMEEQNQPQMLKQVAQAKSLIPQVGNYRFQADRYLALGQLLFMHGLKEAACELLKDCQRAATQVSAAYVNSARGQCLNVLTGRATRTLQ